MMTLRFQPNNDYSCRRFCGQALLALAWLVFSPTLAQATTYVLGTTALAQGPVAGSNSVALLVTPKTGTWSATANATWLHLTAGSGTGSGDVVFSYDANPGATRSGTLTIAGQAVTITQAGSSYVAVQQVVTLSTAFSLPVFLTADAAGNVYIADSYAGAIKKWSSASQSLSTLIPGLQNPIGVAVDAAGDIYFTDSSAREVRVWSGGTVTTLDASTLSPVGVAVDNATNVFYTDSTYNDLFKLTGGTNNSVLISGMSDAGGVAVDVAGNAYVATGNSVQKWTAASGGVTTLASVANGVNTPDDVAVDGSGNVYIDDVSDRIWMWNAASGAVTPLVSSGLDNPNGVAVDGSGNVYIADSLHYALKELPHAFVDPTSKSETVVAGSDSLPAVVPATANLQGLFAPVSDQNWLTIDSIVNGVVNFSYTANYGPSRVAHISLLGQTITVTQGGASYSLGTTSLAVGPAAQSNSVVLGATPTIASWTVTASDSWLHVPAAYQNGQGSTNVVFSCDANPGPTRMGTLTIIGRMTVTVTQAGATYVPVTNTFGLVPNLFEPQGLSIDTNGNVYLADQYFNNVQEWVAASNTVKTLVSSGLDYPFALAVDNGGDVFIPDITTHRIDEYTNGSLVPLITNGVQSPFGLALDASNNIYIANGGGHNILEWTAASSTLSTLLSSNSATPLNNPYAIAIDAAGNLYIADYGDLKVKKWTAASGTLTTLVTEGSYGPTGVSADGSGNVFIADDYNSTIQEWSAASNTLTTLYRLNNPSVAVDGTDNLYFFSGGDTTAAEVPHAFVDPTPVTIGPAAGSGTLPAVVPASQNLLPPFNPASSQSWLAVTNTSGGVVTFAFTANPTPSNRVASLTLLGVTIPVTQTGVVPPPILINAMTLSSGKFQFQFTNANQTASFTVLSSTDLSLPLSNWTVLGTASNLSGGFFQFTDASGGGATRFYTVRSP